ncbi:rubrerythrin [Geothermobacter ehrlichii]|uniref:Rubrerythrin n=1 Tax=Geothermobacter ehrlichii TaxID=213224 RepID=A0A5D3WLZ8_9BACT|nr:ferritin [Geothermobacter ehrlichii]TYO99223.1 rubrerythrin [Geothermobacter ehrlichii]
MPQEMKVQEAIRIILKTKKDLYGLYREASRRAEHPSGRQVFARLADEVRDNMRQFFHLYYGDDLGTFEQFIETPPASDSRLMAELKNAPSADLHDRHARELALHEEKEIERQLRMTAARVIDPVARQILERAADQTRQHHDLIESEYARTMGMVHETDIDTYVRE